MDSKFIEIKFIGSQTGTSETNIVYTGIYRKTLKNLNKLQVLESSYMTPICIGIKLVE